MESTQTSVGFKIWGVDDVVYGPVELPTLVEWVKDERVTADTWIFNEQTQSWQKAARLKELQVFFRPGNAVPKPPGSMLKPGAMRRVKILAELNDEQLERFIEFMEVQNSRQWNEVVKQGEEGDAMFLVLDGELRVRLMIGGKETILTTLGPGEFFGEMALFDHGPRSADVVANKDSTLVKISSTSFDQLSRLAPDIAAPFLFAIGKTLAARIRADNKRYKDQINWARTANAAAH